MNAGMISNGKRKLVIYKYTRLQVKSSFECDLMEIKMNSFSPLDHVSEYEVI